MIGILSKRAASPPTLVPGRRGPFFLYRFFFIFRGSLSRSILYVQLAIVPGKPIMIVSPTSDFLVLYRLRGVHCAENPLRISEDKPANGETSSIAKHSSSGRPRSARREPS